MFPRLNMRKAVATVSFKNIFGFLARRFPGLMAGLGLLVMAGCGTSAGSTINDILEAQLRAQNNGLLPTETARIVLVNETQSTIELDLLFDGETTTITCTAIERRCEYAPTTCPNTIEVVEERHLNDRGAFTGGREYDHNPAFIFTRDKFNCESTIVFTFTEDETTPQVL